MTEQGEVTYERTARGDLDYLVKVGATEVTLEDCHGLARLALVGLHVQGPLRTGGVGVLLYAVLSDLVDERRQETFRRRAEFKQQTARKAICCQVAAAGELLRLTDDDLFEKFKGFRCKQIAETWQQLLDKTDNQGETAEVQLRAALWLWTKSSKTAAPDRRQPELLDTLEKTISIYLDTSEDRRDSLRRLAMGYLAQPSEPAVVSTSTHSVVAPPEPSAKSSGNQDERGRSVVYPQLQRTIDELADVVRRQWQDEKRQRERHDFLLPVRWINAAREYADHPVNISGEDNYDNEPALLNSSLDSIANVLSIPTGRLVVIGQGGAGKTTLVVDLLLALFAPERRSSGQPVPVIVNLASWKPDGQSLENWIAGRLAAEYPMLKTTVSRKVTLAAQLVRGRHLLPIFDGFDEIPPDLRGTAIRALNRYEGRFVLTSRIDEYFEAVDQNGVLSRAAVIELQDLTFDDISGYLPRTARPLPAGDDYGTKWDPVLSRLRDEPDDAQSVMLLDVFTTPLMVSLARAVYSDTSAEPIELLDPKMFPNADVVSDHLIDQFVHVRYDDLPQDQGRRRRSWRAEDAERWLGFLAVRLHAMGTRDLAWWNISTVGFTAISELIGFLIFLAGFIGLFELLSAPPGTNSYVPFVALAYWCCALVGIGLSFGSKSSPRKVTLRHARSLGMLKSDPSRESTLYAGALMCSFMFIDIATPILHAPVNLLLVAGGVTCAVSVLMIPLIAATDRVSLREIIDPRSLLHNDVSAALVRGFLFGISSSVFAAVFLIVYRWPSFLVEIPFVVVAAIIGTLLGSASGQWFVSCLCQMVKRRLPWPRTMDFLEDAHRRGVLRRVGGVYQFRHAFLQDRLARQALFKRELFRHESFAMYAQRSLAIESLSHGRLEIAESELRAVLDLQTSSGDLVRSQTLLTWYYLIVTLRDAGRLVEARAELRTLRDAQRQLLVQGWRNYLYRFKRFIELLTTVERVERSAYIARSAERLNSLEKELTSSD